MFCGGVGEKKHDPSPLLHEHFIVAVVNFVLDTSDILDWRGERITWSFPWGLDDLAAVGARHHDNLAGLGFQIRRTSFGPDLCPGSPQLRHTALR